MKRKTAKYTFKQKEISDVSKEDNTKENRINTGQIQSNKLQNLGNHKKDEVIKTSDNVNHRTQAIHIEDAKVHFTFDGRIESDGTNNGRNSGFDVNQMAAIPTEAMHSISKEYAIYHESALNTSHSDEDFSKRTNEDAVLRSVNNKDKCRTRSEELRKSAKLDDNNRKTLFRFEESDDESDCVSFDEELFEDINVMIVKTEKEFDENDESIQFNNETGVNTPTTETVIKTEVCDEEIETCCEDDIDDESAKVLYANHEIKEEGQMVIGPVEVQAPAAKKIDIAKNNLKSALTCSTCNQSYSTRIEYKRHRKTHEYRPFSCKLCDKRYKYAAKLKLHMKNAKHLEEFKCQTCDETFADKRRLLRHKTTHESNTSHLCDMCGNTYNSRQYFIKHLKSHTITDYKDRFTCKDCNKQFTFLGNLTRHKESHYAKAEKFPCDICFKNFSRRDNLKIHKKLHNDTHTYSCDRCGKYYADKSNFNRHRRIYCTNEPETNSKTREIIESATAVNKYYCDKCDIMFDKRLDLLRHCVAHPKETSFKCRICSKKYTKKHNLTKHMTNHRPYTALGCELCKKQFTKLIFLNKHKHVCPKSRNKYICDSCERVYVRRTWLVKHLRRKHEM